MLTALGFWVLAVLAVVSGALVFRVDSMARATFLLLTSFLAVGGVLLMLAADFLGVILVLMLIGEMVIMAVFMVMYMMNPAGLMPMSMVHNRVGSLVISGATFLLLAAGAVLTPWPPRRGEPPADATIQVGLGLFGPKMLAMIALAAALFATMVGGIVLATARGRYDRYGDGLDAPRAADPTPGAVGR
ncbi:MAG: NADH-quinone oxidoreductase subunit J [Actinomycetota bacterium]